MTYTRVREKGTNSWTYVCMYTDRCRLTDIVDINNDVDDEQRREKSREKERRKRKKNVDVISSHTQRSAAQHSYHTTRERQEKKTLCAYINDSGRVIVVAVKMRFIHPVGQ